MKSKYALLSVITLAASVLTLNTSAFADQTGVVDLNKVLLNYNKSQSARQTLQASKESLQKFVETARKSVQSAKTTEQKKTLENKYNAELRQKISVINQEQNKKAQEIQLNIYNAVKDIAAQKKLSPVLTKESVIVGGEEITNDVINELNTPPVK